MNATKTLSDAPAWMLKRATDIVKVGEPDLDKVRAQIIEAMQEAGREVAFYFAGQNAKLRYEAGAQYQQGVIDTMRAQEDGPRCITCGQVHPGLHPSAQALATPVAAAEPVPSSEPVADRVNSLEGYAEWHLETLSRDDGEGGYVGPMEAYRAGRRHLWATLATLPAPQAAEPALSTCNCRWDGETQVQSCTLHEAWKDTLHENGAELRHLRAALTAGPATLAAEPISDALLTAAKAALSHMCKVGCPGVDELDEAITDYEDALATPVAAAEPTDEQIDREWHAMGSFSSNDHRYFARRVLALRQGTASGPEAQPTINPQEKQP